jgi:predicted lipoprotein with Yx(FWY)xxD motif
MTRSRPITFLASAAVIPLTALTLVAGANTANAGTPHPTIDVRRTALGEVVVDSRGRTLYLFRKDSRGKSKCSGACAVNWPPVLVSGKPVGGSGVKASKLHTTKRSDGRTQVVYNGHPLYRFIGDRKPGNTTGQGVSAFGASWFVVSPAGNEIR